MIEIEHKAGKTLHMLRVSGHAGYAAHGEDIVCAGVSAITYALLGMLENNDQLTHGRRLTSGDVDIAADRTDKTDAAFEMAMIGFGMIAAKYPQCVSIHISGTAGDPQERL